VRNLAKRKETILFVTYDIKEAIQLLIPGKGTLESHFTNEAEGASKTKT
jgi:hypothetical protein